MHKSKTKEQHGMRHTPEYGSWLNMHKRCEGKGAEHNKKDYIERGIQVCTEWNSFKQFYADMGPRPEGTTLERVDNSKGYSKDNCKWATAREQSLNRRTNIFVTHNGETLCAKDWARRYNLVPGTLNYRLKKGMTLEEAISLPVQPRKRKQ